MHSNWLQTAVLHLNGFRKTFLVKNKPTLFRQLEFSCKTFHTLKPFSEFGNNKLQRAALLQLWKSPLIYSNLLYSFNLKNA